jgi:ribosomal protein L44E
MPRRHDQATHAEAFTVARSVHAVCARFANERGGGQPLALARARGARALGAARVGVARVGVARVGAVRGGRARARRQCRGPSRPSSSLAPCTRRSVITALGASSASRRSAMETPTTAPRPEPTSATTTAPRTISSPRERHVPCLRGPATGAVRDETEHRERRADRRNRHFGGEPRDRAARAWTRRHAAAAIRASKSVCGIREPRARRRLARIGACGAPARAVRAPSDRRVARGARRPTEPRRGPGGAPRPCHRGNDGALFRLSDRGGVRRQPSCAATSATLSWRRVWRCPLPWRARSCRARAR